MPLLKKWQEIVRQTNLDQGVVVRRATRQLIEIMRMVGNDEHIKNPGEFLARMAALGSSIGQAEALSKKNTDILENNQKPTSDERRWESVEEQQKRGNDFRMNRGV